MAENSCSRLNGREAHEGHHSRVPSRWRDVTVIWPLCDWRAVSIHFAWARTALATRERQMTVPSRQHAIGSDVEDQDRRELSLLGRFSLTGTQPRALRAAGP